MVETKDQIERPVWCRQPVLLRARRLTVGDKHVRLTEDGAGPPERPLLNHVALLVDSATQVREAAEQAGVDVEDFVDAANTLAVFLAGPAGIRLEYAEHKPGFALK